MSVSEARRLRAEEQAAGSAEIARYVEMARNAEQSGKPGTARIYYQMAARRASGELRADLLKRVEQLRGGATEDSSENR